MKKIFSLLGTAITNAMFIMLIAFATYALAFGLFGSEERTNTLRVEVPCNEECQASLNGDIPADGKIGIERPVLYCAYKTFPYGRMVQMYWLGPWTTRDGGPLPAGVTPDHYIYGEPLAEASYKFKSKIKCKPTYDLAYGQRGVHSWWY